MFYLKILKHSIWNFHKQRRRQALTMRHVNAWLMNITSKARTRRTFKFGNLRFKKVLKRFRNYSL